ncbi:hypothetical protein QZH41_005098 [Actinostola sp. cb2023]|nr:hypothetical protein QZH41_005098 [Actinostola sp. cb2023]
MGDVEVECLMDTGSAVSLVTETFYKEKLQPKGEDVQDIGGMLKLTAANGLEIPYIGFIELDVLIEGQTIPKCGILVLKDTPAITEHRKVLPGLLGTNVLARVPKFAELLNSRRETMNTVYESKKTGFVKVAGSSCICVPSYSVTDVTVTGPKCGPNSLVEPLGVPVAGSLQVANTLVKATRTCYAIQVSNHTSKDVWLKPRTRLGTIKGVEHVTCGEQLLFDVKCNEVIVSCPLSADYQKTPSGGTGNTANTQSREELPTGITLDNFQGTEAEREKALKLIATYADVFAQEGGENGCTPTVQHRIQTVDDVPVSQRHRRIPPNLFGEVKQHLQELLQKGVIKPSQSDYASPIVLVRKKSGALRMCVDYRQLNAKTRRDAYPLPRIDESLDALGGAKHFSTIDLASAYNQVEVEPADRHKTAFTTPMGLFEYTRMPFGLNNSPATFQRLMQNIFRDDLLQILLVYLDDIIVYSSNVAEHLGRLEHVFQKLREHGLKIEPKKCSFFKTKVNYLGHVVSAEGIETDPAKTEVVANWTVPKTLKEVRSFLGFASYYRRFVPEFAKTAKPLHALVAKLSEGGKVGRRRNKAINDEWNADCQKAFEEIKTALTNPPTLAYPVFTEPFILETDASNDGLGAVLSQTQDGRKRVIAYASRGLRGAEKNMDNYSSMKLELLALKWAITDKFREYLIGSKFTVYTDNNPLTYLKSKSKLKAIEQRWVSELASFDFDIKYRAGQHNQNADALSRLRRDVEGEWTTDEVQAVLASSQESTTMPQEARVELLQAAVFLADSSPAHGHRLLSELNESATSLPTWDSKHLQDLQERDPSIGRLIHYRALGRSLQGESVPMK